MKGLLTRPIFWGVVFTLLALPLAGIAGNLVLSALQAGQVSLAGEALVVVSGALILLSLPVALFLELIRRRRRRAASRTGK